MRTTKGVAILVYAVLFLFFLQLLSDFVGAVYAFGLMVTNIPPEIASLLFLFSPLLLILLHRGVAQEPPAWLMVVLGEAVLLCRVVEPLLDTRGRMLVAGLGASLFLIFFPLYLWHAGRKEDQARAWLMGAGLTMALALSIAFRSLNSGFDLSTGGWFQLIGLALALAAGLLMPRLFAAQGHSGVRTGKPSDELGGSPSRTRISGLAVGVMAVFTLLYFAFSSPTVVSRWTGANYLLILAVITAVLTLFTWIVNRQQLRPTRLAWPVLIGWNAVFALALALVALAHQPGFPAAASAYPLVEPRVPLLAQLPLLLALLLYPVLLVDFVLLTEALIAARPTLGRLGLAFGVGSLFLLLMIFAQVFTTTYDYFPVIGPAFRDQFWLVLLLPGLVLTLTVLLARRPVQGPADGPSVVKGTGAAFSVPLLVMVGLLGAISLGGAWLIGPRSPTTVNDRNVLRVLTYNIQQGYDETGRRSEEAQLSLIRRLAPDIIGLQESDNARIAGGNSDLVRTFADRLDMYSYYGPKTVAGTFGIALLSKYPIRNPQTFYVYSEGEQVAVIAAQVEVGDQVFNVYVTHLGNGGPLIQQEQFLETLAGKERVIAMGDFNFKPGGEQYELTTTVLDDSWWRRWPDGVDDQGVRPDALPFGWSWLDHIFVSPDVEVVDARYVLEPTSDHPPVTADITW